MKLVKISADYVRVQMARSIAQVSCHELHISMLLWEDMAMQGRVWVQEWQ